MRPITRFAAAIVLAAGLSGTATAQSETTPSETATAIFAGGCFWCVEADFDKLPGVLDAVSGYSGGAAENPTYEDVTYGNTGHYEVVEVTYDPARVTYRELVDYFLRHVDPTDEGGQFCDRGESYRTAIFVDGPEERAAAEAAKAEADAVLEAEVVTPILDAGPFWPAEDYHQDYYLKNALQYSFYRISCGRDARIREVWGDPDSPS